MIALLIVFQMTMLGLNVALIERGAVFESTQSGVSWISVVAALFIAGCIGFAIRSSLD